MRLVLLLLPWRTNAAVPPATLPLSLPLPASLPTTATDVGGRVENFGDEADDRPDVRIGEGRREEATEEEAEAEAEEDDEDGAVGRWMGVDSTVDEWCCDRRDGRETVMHFYGFAQWHAAMGETGIDGEEERPGER